MTTTMTTTTATTIATITMLSELEAGVAVFSSKRTVTNARYSYTSPPDIRK